ncbi:dipeptidyl aminopeptidase [Paenibacillus mesophilus]|uniref:alpha/beta fold hydrolase n=1 Tax=Paenibacillus mesophilus TaxID=2582849 RepID=UPI00110E089C|nr:alpha/beta fold hydrolase [Paenibacillus mesophilus]TMV51489.1 dipeptidyl aminopeptidase [Paenibacillus mesophilus]
MMDYALSGSIPDLLPHFSIETDSGHTTSALWDERRGDIASRLLSLCGGIPEPEPVSFTTLGSTTVRDGIELRKIRYSTYDNDHVSAYLLLPPNTGSAGRLPAVVAMHQTFAAAKDEVAGIAGDPELAYGIELAARGYVVLAPDVLTAGERVYAGAHPFQTAPFEERYPEWSMIGKMLYDHRQGVELLCGLDFVDGGKIAAIGHSLGGYNAFLLSAFDERIKAAVVSCGFSTFAGDARPERWGKRKEWFTHFPKLNEFLRRGRIPFEFNEILALTFPRSVFVWYTQNDTIFPHWEPIGKGVKTVGDFYADMGKGSRFAAYMGGGKHEFPRPVREVAYRWMDDQLKAE